MESLGYAEGSTLAILIVTYRMPFYNYEFLPIDRGINVVKVAGVLFGDGQKLKLFPYVLV
jgi:hypothetical protein